jgi:TolA-binding protein
MAKISKKWFILVMGAAMAIMATGAFAQSAARPADKVLYDRGIENIEHGDAHALAQAEAEYRDFILFYPDMKEAAELQVGEPLRKIREQRATTPR